MKSKLTDKEKLVGALHKLESKGYATSLSVTCLDEVDLMKSQHDTAKAVYAFEDDAAEAFDDLDNFTGDFLLTYEMNSKRGKTRTMPIIKILAEFGLSAEPLEESWEDTLLIRKTKRGRTNGRKTAQKR